MTIDREQNIIDHLRKHNTEDGFNPMPPGTPTDARPGTNAKLDILANRVLAGEELHHPDDLNYYGQVPQKLGHD